MKKGMPTYSAVVESGSHDRTATYYEERMHCGHAHRTIEAAERCGARNYASRYEGSRWTANQQWHGWTVHDQDQRRVTV